MRGMLIIFHWVALYCIAKFHHKWHCSVWQFQPNNIVQFSYIQTLFMFRICKISWTYLWNRNRCIRLGSHKWCHSTRPFPCPFPAPGGDSSHSCRHWAHPFSSGCTSRVSHPTISRCSPLPRLSRPGRMSSSPAHLTKINEINMNMQKVHVKN